MPAVQLRAMRDVINVNALPEEQRLTFLTRGVTIVYGDNGSGKSGYVRILKHACRARGPDERILKNIYTAPPGPQQAVIDFTAGMQDQWTCATGSRPGENRCTACEGEGVCRCAWVAIREAKREPLRGMRRGGLRVRWAIGAAKRDADAAGWSATWRARRTAPSSCGSKGRGVHGLRSRLQSALAQSKLLFYPRKDAETPVEGAE